nr:DUF4351 domain-containing protein [Crenothrix polyspora]
MLAETVRQWTQKAEQEGRQAGLQEGRQAGLQEGLNKGRHEGRHEGLQEGRQQEAAKLFLLLLESKFGKLSLLLEDKVRSASPEQIEAWTKQIFQAKAPEELLNS